MLGVLATRPAAEEKGCQSASRVTSKKSERGSGTHTISPWPHVPSKCPPVKLIQLNLPSGAHRVLLSHPRPETRLRMQRRLGGTHCPPSPCKPSPTLLTASKSQTSLKDGVRRGTGMGISSAAVYAAGVSEDAPSERVSESGMAREVCDIAKWQSASLRERGARPGTRENRSPPPRPLADSDHVTGSLISSALVRQVLPRVDDDMARQGSTHGDVADDERTPLLATSVSPRPPRSTRPRPSAPPRDTKRDTLTLPWLARSLAALRAGHLPSSQQLLALARTLLDSPFLSDAHADAHVTHAATLSKEGEKVQTAVRRAVESLSELVRGRNPWVCWDEERDEWIGRAGEVDGPGDGWQEFVSACRRTSVDIGALLSRVSGPSRSRLTPPPDSPADLPSTTLPAPSPADLAAAQSSLLTLVQLPLTSPAFLSLVSDLVMLLRDLVTATLDKAETDDLINVEAGEAVKSVVEGVAADVVCQGDTPAKIEGRPPPGNSAQEMEDDIVHRLQQVWHALLPRTRAG